MEDLLRDEEFSEKVALEAFNSTLKKIEQVRHVSSPIFKVIILSRVLDELLGIMS